MKKVLYMLGEFTDQDIDWLISTGQREHITKGAVLIQQGQPVEEIFFVLRGQLNVSIENVGEIARIGSGEIVGELSLLDSRPPNATVTALEDSVVMADRLPCTDPYPISLT
jgi:CRP-like cAMP-binding protein